MTLRHILMFAASLWLCVPTAPAHDYWLIARPAMPEPGESVSLELTGGHRFPGSEIAVAERMLHQLEIIGPDGAENFTPVLEGKQWVANWLPPAPGVYRAVVTLKRPRDEKPFASAHAVVVVAAPDVGGVAANTRGKGLEIVPRDPVYTWTRGRDVDVDVHLDGNIIAADVGLAREGSRMMYRKSSATRPAVFHVHNSGYYLLMARHGGHVVSMSFYVAESNMDE